MKRQAFFTVMLLGVVFIAHLATGQVEKRQVVQDARYLQYKGVLTDTSGEKLDGEYTLRFTMYNSPEDEVPRWVEVHDVLVEEGEFKVLLGKRSRIPADKIKSYYIGISADGEELLPRQPITVLSASDVVTDHQAAPDIQSPVRSPIATLYRSGGGWMDDGTVVRLMTSSDSVGIGTTSPSAKLEVVGSSAGNLVIAENTEGGTGLRGEGYGSSANSTTGIYGYGENSSSGQTYGGHFYTDQSAGGTGSKIGVRGAGYGASSSATYGAYGYASNTGSGPAYGVYGSVATSGTGSHYGVYGSEASGGSGAAVHAAGDLTCSGTKSAVIKTSSSGHRLLYAIESPEIWFEDFGEGQLRNGRTHIDLAPLFLETVTIDYDHPMKVFVQIRGDCRGTYVQIADRGFDVIELQGGTSDVPFSYRIVAKRKGYENERLRETDVGYDDPTLYPELWGKIEKEQEEEW